MANYRKHANKTSFEAASSDGESDQELAKIVKSAIDNVVEYVREATNDRLVPFTVCLMMSLNHEQLYVLEEENRAIATDDISIEPLFLSDNFKQLLDPIQTQLLLESKIWLLPRS